MSLTEDQLSSSRELKTRLVDALETVIHGKRAFLERLVLAVTAGGHVLIEDVPGLGKTTAAKALARVIHDPDHEFIFRRIQFTPDLLPYDITGVEVFNPESRTFEFNPGPIFSHIVLADEINRTTPKVQSALLEVMEEAQVTVGKITRPMSPFFFVMATQNPIEMEGTYPLPAAQLDRFLMKLSVGYPDHDQERRVLMEDPTRHSLLKLEPSVESSEILLVRQLSEEVFVDPKILDIIQGVLESSRDHKSAALGLSPRSGVLFVRALRVWALLQGRDYVIDQDLKDLGPEVLAHRLHMKNQKVSARGLIQELMTNEMAKLS